MCFRTTDRYRFLCSRPPRRRPGFPTLGPLLSSRTSPQPVFSPDVAIQLSRANRAYRQRAQARCQLLHFCCKSPNNQKTPDKCLYFNSGTCWTWVLPSVRPHSRFSFLTMYCTGSRQIDGLPDLLHTDRRAVLDRDEHLSKINRPCKFDHFPFLVGDFHRCRFLLAHFRSPYSRPGLAPGCCHALRARPSADA